MSTKIKHYTDLNEMLDNINLPRMWHPLFYITKFEKHKFSKKKSSIYMHDYFEIALNLGYDVNISVDVQTKNALSHNLIFISPGQIVKWKGNNKWNGSGRGYILMFKPEFLSLANGAFQLYEDFPFLNKNTLPSYNISAQSTQTLVAYLDRIHDEYKRFDESSLEIIRSFLTILLFEAKRTLGSNVVQKSQSSRTAEITYLFEQAIIQTPHKRQPIKYYANQLNLSPVYLSEAVKKESGKTAKAIIDEYAILEIKSLLKYSNDPIAQIAFNLNFEDSSNFVKYFKKHTGFTPKGFRET